MINKTLIQNYQKLLSQHHGEIIRLKNSNEEHKHQNIALLDRESGIFKSEINRLMQL